MKISEAMNKTCPFSTKDRDAPVYCGADNCMAWVENGVTQEGEYMNVKNIMHGYCKLIGEVGE